MRKTIIWPFFSYRAKEYKYDEYGVLTSEKMFHNIQNSVIPSGDYSEKKYLYERNLSGYITKRISILPSGARITDYYESVSDAFPATYKVSKQVRGNVVEFQNSYSVRNNKVVLDWSVNKNGVTTNYTYDTRGNLITRVDPAPGVFGKTGTEHRLTTHYRYDAYDRITLEWANDGKAATIYEYDEFGNLTLQAKGTVVYPSGIPIGQKGNLQSRYEYNEYNEQTLSYDCDTTDPLNLVNRNVHRMFYSNTGVKIAEGAYLQKDFQDPNDPTIYYPDYSCAISAVFYKYDANGRLVTKKTANKDTAFSFNGADPEGGTPDSSWIKEVYQYDAYGRKTAVIADAGTGGKNLTTIYEYNNQSEVERVTTPDMHYTQTIRDGRGLVTEVITGVKVDGQYEARATTYYYYDLNGNLTKKKDPTGVCDCYAYDALGRRTRTWRTNE